MDAPEALREFLAYVVSNLIDHPQQASIAVGRNASGAVVYRVELAPQDVRHVIGKNIEVCRHHNYVVPCGVIFELGRKHPQLFT